MIADELFYGTKIYHKKLTEFMEPLKQYFGITSCGYLKVDLKGNLINVHTNYKWMERYVEQDYYKIDPNMVNPPNINNGFIFLDSTDNEIYKNTLLNDLVHNFDFNHGFAYIEKSKSSFISFGFGTDKNNNKMLNKLLNEIGLVKKFIRDLYRQIESSCSKLEENKIDLTKCKGELFYQQKGLVFIEPQENHNKIKMLCGHGFLDDDYKNIDHIKLSAQEINCLRIYMEDRNIKYVAKKLNIALTTATSYIENIKQKLNCFTKEKLLKKAKILESLGQI